MLAAERHHRILTAARSAGTVRTVDLAAEFGVAEETIRRDLDALAAKGKLTRTHGGAMHPASRLAELPQHQRESVQKAEKSAIASVAAGWAKAGETIVLDASSTALELTSFLPPQVRVVTYSLAVIERLAGRDDLELIQLGGIYEPRGRRFAGVLTENALRSLRVDRFFFSGGGLDAKRGVSEPNPEQARLKSLILDHAAWACALIDHTKLNLCADYFFAKPADFQVLVTDAASKKEVRKSFRGVPYQIDFGA